jgi:NADPH2:quinone reductase
MKAWVVKQWCKPEEMEFAEVALPEPGEGQARIRVEAAALNFLDTLMIQGLYQVKPPFPFTPGVEIGGVVDAVGSGSKFAPGDRVCAMIGTGGFAQYALASDREMVRLAPSMSTLEGSVFPVVYGTAHLALRDGARMRAGETVLIHAGAGGVGLASIQVAKAWGGKVIATAGGPEKVAVCREHGADVAIDYNAEPWLERVKEATSGRGADIVIDMVGGEVTEQSVRVLAWRGRLMIVGFAGGKIPAIPANRLLLKSASAMGVFWGGMRAQEPTVTDGVMADLMAMYERGELKPVVSKTYPLAHAPQALADLATRRTHGKVVLVP